MPSPMEGTAQLIQCADLPELEACSEVDEGADPIVQASTRSAAGFSWARARLAAVAAVGLFVAVDAAFLLAAGRGTPVMNRGMAAAGHAIARGRQSLLYSDGDLWENDRLPGLPIADASVNASSSSMAANTGAAQCEDGEEKFLGECYKSCSDLTEGKFPSRFAPNGCCKELSLSCLNPSDVRFSMPWPGHGMMVGGDGTAPHPPGECDPNEEGMLGLCYKKCSVLSQDEYPIRSASNTCCSQHPCTNFFHLKTVGLGCNGFGVGGGAKGHGCPHKRSKPTHA